MKTCLLVLGVCCVALVGWLIVDTEAETRRSAFRLAKIETRLGERENENAWLRNRVAMRAAKLVGETELKRAGLDVAAAPVRRVAAPPRGRPGP
jgi:hypothetical protein